MGMGMGLGGGGGGGVTVDVVSNARVKPETAEGRTQPPLFPCCLAVLKHLCPQLTVVQFQCLTGEATVSLDKNIFRFYLMALSSSRS